MWGEITNPFPNFNGTTVEVREWISNFIRHIKTDVIAYPCSNYSWSTFAKGVPAGMWPPSWFRERLVSKYKNSYHTSQEQVGPGRTTTKILWSTLINTLRPRQNGRRFADDTFKRIFLNENVRISIKLSLKFVPKGAVNNNPSLVHMMAWCRSGDKPLSEPMMVSLLTHICVTWPQWVKDSSDADVSDQFLINADLQVFAIWEDTKLYKNITTCPIIIQINTLIKIAYILFYWCISPMIFVLCFKFHLSLFLRVQWTVNHHWSSQWLVTKQETSHYLNQWWSISFMHICITKHKCVNKELSSLRKVEVN